MASTVVKAKSYNGSSGRVLDQLQPPPKGTRPRKKKMKWTGEKKGSLSEFLSTGGACAWYIPSRALRTFSYTRIEEGKGEERKGEMSHRKGIINPI